MGLGSGCKLYVISKPEKSTLRFSDCTEICVIVEGADNCTQTYWKDEADHSDMTFFRDFT